MFLYIWNMNSSRISIFIHNILAGQVSDFHLYEDTIVPNMTCKKVEYNQDSKYRIEIFISDRGISNDIPWT